MSLTWDKNRKPKPAPKKYEPRTVCLVDREHANRLEGKHVLGCVGFCKTHFTRTRAEAMYASGEVEWIGIGKGAIRFKDPRTWKNVYSDGYAVMQLVA